MLKELEDYNWFPKILRRWQMEFIGTIAIWIKLYQPLTAILKQMIEENRIINLQDLCSGSGIPAIYIHRKLAMPLPLPMLLTDKYPDESFVNKPAVIYSVRPVDALAIQPVENTCYTMFNAFHHFTNTQQSDFINNMKANNAPFLIAEILEPGIINGIKIFFTTTLLQLLTAPFVKPFSVARLFFTYIMPVNLFTVTYDGIISVIKSKTARQYSEVLKNISTPTYTVSIKTIHNFKENLVYIKGQPINK
jgi:hypothetical protein